LPIRDQFAPMDRQVSGYPQAQIVLSEDPAPRGLMDANQSERRKPTMTTAAADETWERLGAIAQLLHRASSEVWSAADQAAPDSPLHDLGLGVYLAHSQASALMPEDHVLPEVDLEPEVDLHERTALQLLTEAEKLTRALPLHRPDLVAGSQLVVDLCDLIREARGLGY